MMGLHFEKYIIMLFSVVEHHRVYLHRWNGYNITKKYTPVGTLPFVGSIIDWNEMMLMAHGSIYV
jgi:hypothetical protein